MGGKEKNRLYMKGFEEMVQKYKEENKERAERFKTKPEILTHAPQFQPFYDVKPQSNKFIKGLPDKTNLNGNRASRRKSKKKR